MANLAVAEEWSLMPRKPSVEESEDGGQQPRMGFSDEECCVPKFCKNFLCPLACEEQDAVTGRSPNCGASGSMVSAASMCVILSGRLFHKVDVQACSYCNVQQL